MYFISVAVGIRIVFRLIDEHVICRMLNGNDD